MIWNTLTSGKTRFSKHILVSADATSISEIDALEEMWKVMLSNVLPLNAGVVWDYIRLEIWVDTGRVIVYPALLKDEFRVDKACCSLFFASLLKESENLSNKLFGPEVTEEMPDEADQDAYSQAITELELELIRKAEIAAYAAIPANSGLKIVFYSTDDDPLHEIRI